MINGQDLLGKEEELLDIRLSLSRYKFHMHKWFGINNIIKLNEHQYYSKINYYTRVHQFKYKK